MISDRKKIMEHKDTLGKSWKSLDQAALVMADFEYSYQIRYSRSKKKNVKTKVKKRKAKPTSNPAQDGGGGSAEPDPRLIEAENMSALVNLLKEKAADEEKRGKM